MPRDVVSHSYSHPIRRRFERTDLRSRWSALTGFLSLALLVGGCSRSTPGDPGAAPRYAAAPDSTLPAVVAFAVHPLHNPQMLARTYQPLLDRVNAALDQRVSLRLEASRDYAAYEAKIRARAPEFLLANPWQTLLACSNGYDVIAQAGLPEDFRGLLLVRRDSGIRDPADLRGKAIAYPAPTALAACMMPQWFLHERGLDIGHDVENLYVGSQESSIQSVLMGRAAAGATWPPPWRAFQAEHPQEAEQLRVAWETPPLVNNAVLVRRDVPRPLRDGVLRELLALSEDEPGRSLLSAIQTARFLPADSSTYEPVRRFIRRFEREIRPVEGR